MEKIYNHQESERTAQQKWDQESAYSCDPKGTGPLYTIDTPPPTVSGSLHIGHIFSYTQTDIIARYKRMAGFRVFYPFGFDDNGLPTERYVEKKQNIQAHTLPRSEFIARCLQETTAAAQVFTELWQRMGLSASWKQTYSTISEPVRRLSQESFLKLYEKGLVYRQDEPALYCTTCRTSVAQAELDNKEVPSFFYDIIFKDANHNDLIIGTTRPELLSSCVALFFHPSDIRYQHLAHTEALVPLYGHRVPIYADKRVDPEKGTGLVMCCTFGDKTDVEWFKQYKLPYRPSIGRDGRWIAQAGILSGLKVADARKKIVEALKEHNLVVHERAITHAVNIHERCKHEIEFLAFNQWFVNILKDKQRYIELADQISWRPEFMKARYIDWVTNINWDWCISRQRFFGIPFPVWHCADCKAILLASKHDLPIDPQETAYPEGTCTQCASSNIIPDTDVMDTWNTSSLTPYICQELFGQKVDFAQKTDFLPMSLRPQAHDIIRTWAFDTIVKTWMHHEEIPWKDIVISGHVLSDQKEKLSKSKENSVQDPKMLLAAYPADAIRYWTASVTLGQDTAFSEAQIKIGHKLITKLWNAFRFIKEHVTSVDALERPKEYGAVNEWILHQITHTHAQYRKAFDAYEFGAALQTTEHFFWHDFCDNYLELIKNQLFNPQEYDIQQTQATRWTLHQVGLRILQLYAPYMPHITETLYGYVYSTKTVSSIHRTHFVDAQQKYEYATSAKTMNSILEIIGEVRKFKSISQLSLKTPIEVLTIHVPNQDVLDAIRKQEKLITGILHTLTVKYAINKNGDQEAVGGFESLDGKWFAAVIVKE